MSLSRSAPRDFNSAVHGAFLQRVERRQWVAGSPAQLHPRFEVRGLIAAAQAFDGRAHSRPHRPARSRIQLRNGGFRRCLVPLPVGSR